METSQRLYPVHKPVVAALAGASVALLGGLIGLGGAEFRLPLLIVVFDVYPHRAIRINLVISLATLSVSAGSRLTFLGLGDLSHLSGEILAMLLGGMIAAWLGASLLARISKTRIIGIIVPLLLLIAGFLVFEALFSGPGPAGLFQDPASRIMAALLAGLLVGSISSMLGVAGGEFIIPILIFAFGADIKTAGTASVLISVPIVLAGIARHWLTGHYRSRTMLQNLVLPMSLGSVAGAVAGGYVSAWVSTDALRIVLAAILAASSFKLWSSSASGEKPE